MENEVRYVKAKASKKVVEMQKRINRWERVLSCVFCLLVFFVTYCVIDGLTYILADDDKRDLFGIIYFIAAAFSFLMLITWIFVNWFLGGLYGDLENCLYDEVMKMGVISQNERNEDDSANPKP